MSLEKKKTAEQAIVDLSVFGDNGLEMWLHSIRRYQFAARWLRKYDMVLDVCCGSGYGTHIMSQALPLGVFGVERDDNAVKFAKAHYPHCDFQSEDVMKLPISGYDVFVMFECLDHLEKKDGLELLSRMAGARLIIASLPQDQKFDSNPYHLAEWTADELADRLRQSFGTVLIFGQSWATGQILFPYDERRSISVIVGMK